MNKHEPAFPGTELNGNGEPYQTFLGLTKRELFALHILNGFVSNPNLDASNNNVTLCASSIKMADDLIKSLDLMKDV